MASAAHFEQRVLLRKRQLAEWPEDVPAPAVLREEIEQARQRVAVLEERIRHAEASIPSSSATLASLPAGATTRGALLSDARAAHLLSLTEEYRDVERLREETRRQHAASGADVEARIEKHTTGLAALLKQLEAEADKAEAVAEEEREVVRELQMIVEAIRARGEQEDGAARARQALIEMHRDADRIQDLLFAFVDQHYPPLDATGDDQSGQNNVKNSSTQKKEYDAEEKEEADEVRKKEKEEEDEEEVVDEEEDMLPRPVSLRELISKLILNALKRPKTYLTLSEMHWRPYIELLFRCGVVESHPQHMNRIRMKI